MTTEPRSLSNVFPRFYPILPAGVMADIKLSRDDCPVERAFLSDLVMFYAFDLGAQFEMVNYRDLRQLGISESELHEASLRNLRAADLDVRAHQGSHFIMLTAGGNFEATLLLLPEIWESVAPMVQGDIIAATPARDVLYFTGDAEPKDIGELRKWTSQMLEKVDKPLSRFFFRWTAGSWTEYQGFAA
jgi:uncharacterized protein YtpQ (UPF0354 family)